MEKSTFHKLVFMMAFEDKDFEPPIVYDNVWTKWIDDATGQRRCIEAITKIEDINFSDKEIVISYSGKDADSGQNCRGIIFSDFDGNVEDVEAW
jgi:hypothetical protein